MALILVDTNVLLRRMERTSPQSLIAKSAMRTLREGGDELVIASQTLYELWVVLTRPTSARGGFGRTSAEATRLLQGNMKLCRHLPDSQALFALWFDLVQRYQVRGTKAHDARLVAAMKGAGVSHVLTFNVSDFQVFAAEGITVVDPATV